MNTKKGAPLRLKDVAAATPTRRKTMSFGMKFLKAKKAVRIVEVPFPSDKLKDLISSHLYATRYVNDEEDILDLELDPEKEGTMNLRILLKKSK